MPTYEYNCSACNHQFEIIQSIKDEPLKICPNCGEESLRKLVSGGAALIFKGSGFYLTDYKNKPAEESKNNKPSADGDKKVSSKELKTEKSSKDTKVESKPSPSSTKSKDN